MKSCFIIALLIAIANAASTGSFVVSTAATKETSDDYPKTSGIPEIYEMNIHTNVTNRYAKTLITSKVKNSNSLAKEAVFFVVLPEKAFISEFVMEIEGKSYKAYVKEKEEAKNIYDKAVSSGQSAAHVAVSARDSNKFSVSLNIEPESKAIFKLTYEELLQRQKEKYELVLNIHPGMIVPKLEVEVVIDEILPLSFVRTPSLRSGNEISKSNDGLKPNAEIIKINETSTVVKFHPGVEEQIKFAKALDVKESEGLKGQFVVEYDVERKNEGGEVLLNDGYFVHFFAPKEFESIPTQVMFVLDTSGSMMGRKMEQLKDAMLKILDNLKEHDSFSIVTFSTSVQVWNIHSSNYIDLHLGYGSDYGNLEKALKEKELPEPVKATPENIAAAKVFVKTIRDTSLTNIIGGLEVGLFILKNAPKESDNYQQPLLIFLTDGDANVGISDDDAIIETVAKLNPEEKQIPIYSLSFGSGADKNFLRKLSSKNLGFSRHIYEAADSSLQLQDFYQLISSPLLRDITFKYTKNASLTTKNKFPIFFRGSEFVVAGKIPIDSTNDYIVEGWRPTGVVEMKPRVIESVDSLERLWAFLQVRQILNERDVSDNKTELTKEAVNLALKYSFVTPVTSLVVVKPNDTSAVDTEDISNKSEFSRMNFASVPLYPRTGVARIYNTHSMRTGGIQRYPDPMFSGQPLSISSLDNRSPFLYGPPGATFRPIYYPQNLWTSTIPTALKQTLPVPISELQKQDWFKAIMDGEFNIKVDKAHYKLATNETTVTKKTCTKTVSNKSGTCTLMHKCEKAIPLLTDLSKFLDIFCSLEGYAGICCDD